jgi:hypothetical protein
MSDPASTVGGMGPPVRPAPLGFCAKCIARGQRQPATAIVEGTGSCDSSVLGSLAGDDVAGVQHRLRIIDQTNRPPGVLVT